MNGGFWCKYCGKQKAWDDRDYNFGIYLAVVASFEALEHTEYVTPYLICKQCADEAKMRHSMNKIEKTIRVLSDMKLSFSQNYIQEAFDVSIEALREQAEREKGCEGCGGRSSVTRRLPYQCQYCCRNYCDQHDSRRGLEVEHE